MKKAATRLEDLARRAGVSVSTVSRALNDSPMVNLQTKREIWRLARELDYPFRSYMPAGPIGAEATIAVIVPRPQGREDHLADPFLLQLLASVAEAARERGCDILLSHFEPATPEDLDAAMSTSRANGVIFIGQSSLHAAFNRLATKASDFVVWGAELPEQTYCCVGSDNTLGGRRAASHLLRLGRRRIAFLGDIEAPEAMQRHRGYLEAHEQFGLTADPALSVPAHFEVEASEAAVDALIAKGADFDGVVAASDLIALGAMRALQRAGRSVPGDVSILGYDNVPFAKFSNPALSTISQDTAKAGRLMVSKLLEAHGGRPPRSERIPTDLVIRESCGA